MSCVVSWFNMKTNIAIAAFLATTAVVAFADEIYEMEAVYTVPHEMDCLLKSGHIQGACCSEKGFYLSHARGLDRFGWDGKHIRHIDAPSHLGDTAFFRGKVYGVLTVRDKKERKDGKCGLVRVWDEDLNQLDEAWFDEMFDGVTVLGDTIYVGIDRWGYEPHSICAVKRLGLDLSDKGNTDIPLPHPINYGVQTMSNDGKNIFFGMYGAPVDKGNPKRLNCERLTPDLKLLDSFRFDYGCAEGFDHVPESVAKRSSVFFAVRPMGGNAQGWRKDPDKNPPRIRLEFYEYRDGAFKFITKKPIMY